MDVINEIKLAKYLQLYLPGVIKYIVLNDNTIIINIEKKWLGIVLTLLRSLCGINSILDIWCTDYPDNKKRFELNYLVTNYKYNFRIIVRVYLQESEGIESITNLYASAGWLEREVWDMFGIFFYNHNDLRRILTDYGFEGFPLRKDFPLSGFVEIRYDDTEKRIVQEILEVSQDYRNFNFKSPWEKL